MERLFFIPFFLKWKNLITIISHITEERKLNIQIVICSKLPELKVQIKAFSRNNIEAHLHCIGLELLTPPTQEVLLIHHKKLK